MADIDIWGNKTPSSPKINRTTRRFYRNLKKVKQYVRTRSWRLPTGFVSVSFVCLFWAFAFGRSFVQTGDGSELAMCLVLAAIGFGIPFFFLTSITVLSEEEVVQGNLVGRNKAI